MEPFRIEYFIIEKTNSTGAYVHRSQECIIQNYSFCCEEMHLAYDEIIWFGILTQFEAPVLYIGAREGEWYREDFPIQFCPFCGTKFESTCSKVLKQKAVKKSVPTTVEKIEYVEI